MGPTGTMGMHTAHVAVSRNDDHLGENPCGSLGTAQVNPCCWLTPIGVDWTFNSESYID